MKVKVFLRLHLLLYFIESSLQMVWAVCLFNFLDMSQWSTQATVTVAQVTALLLYAASPMFKVWPVNGYPN
jgi:hypothetical protein